MTRTGRLARGVGRHFKFQLILFLSEITERKSIYFLCLIFIDIEVSECSEQAKQLKITRNSSGQLFYIESERKKGIRNNVSII